MFVYRLPSWLAGVASVALAWRIGERQTPGRGWVYALVLGASFPLVAYSVEARGYALAVMFALAVFALFQGDALPSPRRTALIDACVVLGLLSHFSFGYFYAGFGAWSLLRCVRVHGRSLRSLRAMVVLHAVPALLVVALLPLMRAGVKGASGDDWTYAGVVAQALAWTLSLPVPWLTLLVALTVALVVFDARERYRGGDDSWILFPVVIAIAPIAQALLSPPPYFAVRYLLICIAFCLVVISAQLVRTLDRTRWLGALWIALVIGANTILLVPFVQSGRGHYADAVRYMAKHTEGAQIVVASDHDTRNVCLLAYYARVLPKDKQLIYVPQPDRGRRTPQWLITHTDEIFPRAPQHMVIESGARFRLRKVFPYWAPSGFCWIVYEHELPPGT
jgi:hypothetical protein